MELQTVKQRFGIIGNSELLDRALEVALRVAPTDLSVLITGESGVGKEFFPQIIHAFSPRKHGAYVAVNCGAIPEGTIDSELFGHEKGAFTGASESRKGYFEEADKGTIFLDEVAELPQTTQVRLLRVLQTGEYIRVGSSKTRKTDVRVVAATNVNLQQAMTQGRFREDLYYRLNTVPISLPALRQRKDDIYMLFRKFAVDIARQYRMPAIALTPEAKAVLESYAWPGNIRQLKNVAEQISAVEEKREVSATLLERYLPQHQTSAMPALVPHGKEQYTSDHTMERELLYKILFDMRGEVRELRQMVSDLWRAGGRDAVSEPAPSNALVPAAIPVSLHAGRTAYPIPLEATAEEVVEEEVERTKEDVQRKMILKALKKHNGKRKEAARDLFISERTLYRRIRELGIEDN